MRAVVRNVVVYSAWVLVATLVRPGIARADFATVTWLDGTGDTGSGVGAPNPTTFSLNSDGTVTVTVTAFTGDIVDLFINSPGSVWQNLTPSDWIGIPAGYEAVGQTNQYFGTFDGPSIQYNSSTSSPSLSRVSYTISSPSAPFTSVLQLFATNGNSGNNGAGYEVEAIVKNPAGSISEYAQYGGLVAATPVPLPTAVGFMLSGLGAIAAFSGRKLRIRKIQIRVHLRNPNTIPSPAEVHYAAGTVLRHRGRSPRQAAFFWHFMPCSRRACLNGPAHGAVA